MSKLRRRMQKFNGLSVGLKLHKRFIRVPEAVVDRPNPANDNAFHINNDHAEAGPFLRDGALVRGTPPKTPPAGLEPAT